MTTENGGPGQLPDRVPAMAMRASDQERERAVDMLRDAAGEGRLTFEELTDRVESALQATTRGELERLTDDLPDASAPAAPAARRELAAPTHRSTVFGDVRRSGPWTVPEHSSWKTCFGDVVLDLREAHVTAAVMNIEARTIFGDVQLLVPEGRRRRSQQDAVRQRSAGGGEVAPAGAPRVTLVGARCSATCESARSDCASAWRSTSSSAARPVEDRRRQLQGAPAGRPTGHGDAPDQRPRA